MKLHELVAPWKGDKLLQELIPGSPPSFAGLLTHSGSRGVGYAVANHYMRLAAQETKRIADVPHYYEWLDLEHEAGQEYWVAMELCAAFARASGAVAQAMVRQGRTTAHDYPSRICSIAAIIAPCSRA